MSWQAYVRAQAAGVDQVVVCSTDGLYPLYSDLNPIYIPHQIEGQRDCHMISPCTTPGLLSDAELSVSYWVKTLRDAGYAVKRLVPEGNTHYSHKDQRFVSYGSAKRAKQRGHDYAIIVHARARESSLPFGGANYPAESWAEVLGPLAAAGLKIATVGSLKASIRLDGAADLRGLPLDHIMDAMAGARLCMGPSSGPMHLASLCRTPHLVWTGDRFQAVIKGTNETRYKSLWNPLKTPVKVIMKPMVQMPPAPGEILSVAQDMLK